ncbi:EndoU domain-containing protein [Chitinimonas viridis]|uniref:EndoU domain-containing protein n=1 Tax=Chitinimonas viridis TaxID=664880 RepID=A0ABT8B4P9_9NEIS|nr:EndoU domain-containing protein [Chitinimonas viridis]MDN3577224.1 EndoU domain-containing protein [Chitinimonas viridis]
MSCLTQQYRYIALALLCTVASLSQPTWAADCNSVDFDWSTTTPPVNIQHVFCGEIKGSKKVVGFHSVQMKDSAPISSISGITNLRKGIYDATVTFDNGKKKMSTFFPDSCSYDQILASIVYAANNQQGAAQPWGVWGWSGTDGDSGKCMDSDGKHFKIRMGLLNSAVNTAFPY